MPLYPHVAVASCWVRNHVVVTVVIIFTFVVIAIKLLLLFVLISLLSSRAALVFHSSYIIHVRSRR